MALLIVGLILFMATHSVRIFADDWRSQMIARIGEMPWRGINSVASLATFLMVAYGYGQSRLDPVAVWTPPYWMSHAVSLLMLFAMIFLMAAFVPGNGIKARAGHPMIISVKIWAFSHLLANGNLADILLFGSFLVWAVLSFRASRARDRRDSVVRPHGQLLQTLITVVVGALVWIWFVFQGHLWLIGVRPLVLGG